MTSDPVAPAEGPRGPTPWWVRLRRAGPLVLVIVLCVPALYYAGRYVKAEGRALESLWQTPPSILVGMTVMLTICIVLNGLVTRDLVRLFGVDLRAREWLTLTFVGSLLNTVTPVRGGAGLRAVYLKQVHALPYAEFASTTAAMVGFQVAVNAGLAGVCLGVLGVPGGASGGLVLMTCLSLVVGFAAVLWLAPRGSDERAGMLGAALRAARAWRLISRSPRLLVAVSTWTLANGLLHAAAFVLAFRAAGFEGSVLVGTTAGALAKVGSTVAITPAGLGIFEAFGVVSAQIVGADLAASVVAVLLVRVLSTLLAIVGGLVCWPFLMANWGGRA